MQNLIKNFVNDESGATAIEYGLIAALIAVAMIAGATSLGGSISDKMADVGATLDGVAEAAPAAAAGGGGD
ncbi:fimbrial protein [Algimonas ampicilliniresistens]|jgi:pilus assembly protein Flp/PilA|uniref:Fimbrial protein n=1 Tax=Algimonas ampicilliniresistens TaxID=1298735 RepID=A0ABQ5VCY3_9PROT|nr:Flp family type IVb pilin [Algimonas ampicilliniresistens]GLQ24942.1 fimbrial protein [Algimonas ampicilliniresistens]